jgi:hypothetical protein
MTKNRSNNPNTKRVYSIARLRVAVFGISVERKALPSHLTSFAAAWLAVRAGPGRFLPRGSTVETELGYEHLIEPRRLVPARVLPIVSRS